MFKKKLKSKNKCYLIKIKKYYFSIVVIFNKKAYANILNLI